MSLELTYVGHATVLIELDGQRLLTDPMLRRRVWHLKRGPETVAVGKVDAVLVSHGHFDHLDLPSLTLLGRETRMLVPRGLGRLLRRRGFAEVDECEVGDELEVGPLRIRVTPAEHSGARLATKATAMGFLVAGSAKVYFAGDTDLFPGLEAIGAEGLDVALLPIWGWGTKVGPGHLDPEQAAEAARRLRPGLAVPIHWGTYGSRGADLSSGPPERFARACAGDVDVRILAPGERIRIDLPPPEAVT